MKFVRLLGASCDYGRGIFLLNGPCSGPHHVWNCSSRRLDEQRASHAGCPHVSSVYGQRILRNHGLKLSFLGAC